VADIASFVFSYVVVGFFVNLAVMGLRDSPKPVDRDTIGIIIIWPLYVLKWIIFGLLWVLWSVCEAFVGLFD